MGDYLTSNFSNELSKTPSLLTLLERAATVKGDATAIIYLRSPLDPKPHIVTYRELLDEVQAACRAFRAIGVGAEDGVAILLPAIPQAASALIAAAEVGIAFPLNLLLAADALAAQLRMAGTRAAVVLGNHSALDIRERLREASKSTPSLTDIIEVQPDGDCTGGSSWSEFIASAPPEPFMANEQRERVAALFHSGGTSGNPKLTELTAGNLVAGALMAADASGWRSEDRILAPLPIFHVGGAIDGLLASIARHATIILPMLLGARHPEFASFAWRMIDHTKASVLAAVPTSLAAIAEHPVRDACLDRLRAITTGASPLPSRVAAQIQTMSGVPVSQLYGMTETAGIISAQPTDGKDREPAVGYPAPLVSIRIGAPGEPQVQSGEIHVRGPNVCKGYRCDAGTLDPKIDGWLPTGDLGSFEQDGQLRLHGRSKDLIIRGGHNIDPAMIEAAADEHPDVLQAAAVAMPDAYAGELPILFVTLRPGSQTTEVDLTDFVAERIAEPPARPKHVFALEALPLTLVGMIARFKLRQIATEHRARELLAGLPVIAITCSDIAAKSVVIEWGPGTEDKDVRTATAALAEYGLAAV